MTGFGSSSPRQSFLRWEPDGWFCSGCPSHWTPGMGGGGALFGGYSGRKVNEWQRTSSLSPASLPLRLPVSQLSASPLALTSWLSRDCAVCYIFITGTTDGKSHFIMWKMQCSWLSKLHSAGKKSMWGTLLYFMYFVHWLEWKNNERLYFVNFCIYLTGSTDWFVF